MEPMQNYPFNYPVFEADQVLTNDDLNELFNYLDSQERLTRSRLIGMGIVCGLELRYDAVNTAISISKGCGITSWGYLVLQNDTTLKYYRNYSIPTTVPTEDQYAPFTLGAGKAALYELLSDEEYNALNDKSAITALSGASKDFLQDKVVVLYLEMNADALKNCLTGDCDNKGIDMALTLKRLLIGKEDLLNAGGLERIGVITSSGELPDLFLPAINVPATALNDFNALYSAYASVFNTGNNGNIIDQLSLALEKQYQYLSPLLPDFPTSPFIQVKNLLIKRMDNIRKNIPWGIQYYYDFIDDLIKAYNELKNRAHSLISECCPDDGKFPLHLKLGLAQINTAGTQAAFREYFLYSPLYRQQQELIEELRLLFARIKRMIDNFFVPNPSSMPVNTNLRIFFRPGAGSLPVKITPSSNGITPLSERAIPYYYQIDNANPIQESWNYVKTRAGKANQNLSYNADKYNSLPAGQPFISPLLYSTEPYNFLRIEGHIGQSYPNVLKSINQQQNTYRLPFDVVALKLGSDASGIQPDITCSFGDLESQYDVLKSEVFCRLGDQICYYAVQNYTSRIPILFGNKRIFTESFTRDLPIDTGKTASADKPAPQPANAEASGTMADMAAHLENFNFAASQPLENMVQHTDVLKYTSLLPVDLRFLFQVNIYVKGQFLSGRPCFAAIQKPPANTTNVGLVYLSSIKQGAIPAYPPNDLYMLPDYLVKMVDLIEEVISVIYYTQLGYFNADNFNTKYQALTSYAASLLTLVKNNPNAANIPAGLADYLSSVNSCCDPAKLQALQQDYQKRFQSLQQALLFSNFITRNPGIDHKAGVPKGGTFILVYYEKPVETPVSTGRTYNIRSALTANIGNPELLRNVITGGRTILPGGTGGVGSGAGAVSTEGLQPPDKAVVADFYLPYLCCSNCGCGITYIFPTEPDTGGTNPGQQPEFSIQPNRFTYNDSNAYPFTIVPPVTQQDILPQTTDSSKLANPDKLPLTVDGSGKLTLTPSMPGLAATLTSTLRYQNIAVPVTIVRPVATFLVEVKNVAGAAGGTPAVAFTNMEAAAASPVMIGFSAKDTGADKYNWNINGKDGLLPATANPSISFTELARALGGRIQQLTIILTLSYTINKVTADDTRKAVLTLDQLKTNLNKGPFEPAYV